MPWPIGPATRVELDHDGLDPIVARTQANDGGAFSVIPTLITAFIVCKHGSAKRLATDVERTYSVPRRDGPLPARRISISRAARL